MLERELKLNAPADFRLPELSVGELEAVVVDRRYLDAVYYDTADLRLARWGCSLRHRTNEGWTVKLPPAANGDLIQREEISFDGRWDRVPSEAEALVRVYARRALLRPIARLRTVRKPVLLIDDLGRCRAEVVEDDVSTYRGEGPAGFFREIEVELAEGTDPGILDSVVASLLAAGAGPVSRISKLARALGAPALRDPDVVVVEPGDDSTAGDVVRSAVARSVHRFIAHMPGVHLGRDPEELHQARVGTRRLRSDLRTFGPLLDEGWVDQLRDDLRWLGAALGTVRDIDVLTLRLTATARRLPEADGYPLGVMMTVLRSEREVRRRSLLEAVDQERYGELLDQMVDAANDPPLLPAADRPPRKALVELAGAPFEYLLQTIRKLPADPVDADLHRIRIRAKRVRYAAEAVAPVVGKKAARFAAAAADLQDTLGELQDAAVTHAWLENIAQQHPSVAFTAGQLAGFELSRAETARNEWRAAWRNLSRDKLRSWM